MDTVCSSCGDQWEYTEGLEYELDESTDSYIVSGIGTANGDVVIPYAQNGKFVTSIGEGAFYGCSGLTSITIPNSVTSIGGSAFWSCDGLKKVIISDLSAWCNIYFNYNANPFIYNANPLSYAHHLYLGEEEIKDLVIPNDITEIKYCAFSGCRGLTSITIPDSVTSIGLYAFEDCSGLTSITIPDSVTSIDFEAVEGCSQLTDIQFNGTISQWKAIKKGSSWSYNTGNYTITCTDGTIDKNGKETYF